MVVEVPDHDGITSGYAHPVGAYLKFAVNTDLVAIPVAYAGTATPVSNGRATTSVYCICRAFTLAVGDVIEILDIRTT
jgi:hypothetical protein